MVTEGRFEQVDIVDGTEGEESIVVDYAKLSRVIESLLFVAGEPAPIERLASALDVTQEDVEQGLLMLAASLQDRGIRLQRHHDAVQLVTMPEAADVIEVYLGLDLTTKLSRAALETLAIIAYRQPITRPQIEAIRGVSSDGVIRTLLHRGLVQELGRLETPGRPMLFGTTPDFLNYFGISSLEELPPLEDEDVAALTERIEMMGATEEEEEEEETEKQQRCFDNDVQGRLSKVQGQSERCWMMSPTLDLGLRTTFIFIGIGGPPPVAPALKINIGVVCKRVLTTTLAEFVNDVKRKA